MQSIVLRDAQRKEFEDALRIGILKELCEGGLLSERQLQAAIRQVRTQESIVPLHTAV